jgi:glycosyltransferase involved in cell wall biosynthesis
MSIESLLSPAPQVAQLAETPVSRIMHLLWQSRADLRWAFDLAHASGQRGLVRWYRAQCEFHHAAACQPPRRRSGWAGRARNALPGALKRALRPFTVAAAGMVARRAARAGARQALRDTGTPCLAAGVHGRASAPAGFNLVGHALSELGLGQNLRFAASAMRAGKLPHAVVEFSAGVPGLRNPAHHNEAIGHDNPYRINVFMMSPELLPAAYCALGEAFFRGRVNVLYAFWELEQWPAAWRDWLDLFDEVWVPTRFVDESVARAAVCPVYRVSPCVDLPQAAPKGRAELGLPAEPFLFFTSFDAYSYPERKNPLATVRAFRRAFALVRGDVGLVVKVMNASTRDLHWRQVVAECAADPRIILLDGVYAFADLVALYRATDCYVSLHRSEGFGLGMAEAMMCGKPVIATAYSGNLDFTLPGHALLVDAVSVPVVPGHYPHAAGQVWAEPDIERAAALMREVRDVAGHATALGKRAQAWASDHLSPQAVAPAFAAALARHPGPVPA